MQGAHRHGVIAIVFGLGLAIGACDAGSVGPGNGPDAGSGRDQPLGILCNATFKTTGTYVQTMAQPAEVGGCWPVGTWTFTASIDTDQCQPPPALLPSYEMDIGAVADVDGNWDYTYTFATDPTAHVRMKASGDGGGICTGSVEIYSADGKQYWNFKPALEVGNVLDGEGEYALYDSDQWT